MDQMLKILPVVSMWAIGIFFSPESYGQQISYTNPTGLTVCDSAFFEVQITNDTTALQDTTQLQISLANCLAYLPGSVVGAMEGSVSDPQQLHFGIPPIPPSQTATVQIEVFAPCPCYDTLNAGALFTNEIQWFSDVDTLSLSTNPFYVETAHLVITQVTNTVLSGSKGDQFTRTFTIQNTRPGSLSSFLFEDSHQGGVEISADLGMVEANLPAYFALRLSGSDFQLIGDGDAFFEKDEIITITELVTITSCGFDIPSTLSDISVSWGCENLSCQSVFQTALVQFQPATLEAVLEITPAIEAPVCFCADEGVLQSLTIVNTGDEPAFAPVFYIEQLQANTGISLSSANATVNGVPVPLNLEGGGQAFTFLPPCLQSGPYEGSLFIECPDLPPGDTMVLQWAVFFCNPSCAQSQNTWSYDYQFQKSCPPNTTVYGEEVLVQLQNPEFEAQLTGDFQLADGQTQTYSYTINYDSLGLIDGQLEISMTLPCGLVWEDNPLALDGIFPSNLTITTQDTLQFITALYPLPLPDSSAHLSFDLSFYCDSLCQEAFICQDSTLTSCPQPDCAEEAGTSFLFDIQSTLLDCPGLSDSCGLQACESISMGFSCEPDSICFDTIFGYVFYEMDFQRTNLGLPDNDDDRWPDGPEFSDPDLLRLDRSMPGDTVQTTLNGVVYIEPQANGFQYASAKLSFQPLGADPVINPGLYSPEGIVPIDAILEFWDADEDQYYTCPNLNYTSETTTDRLIFQYAVHPSDLINSGCNIPPDFEWEQGDSIWLRTRHKLETNPVKQAISDPNPPVFSVTVRPELAIGQSLEEVLYAPFVCGCEMANWEVTGYEYELLPGVYAIPFCDTSEYQGSTFFKLELGEGNFFPFEYRPLGRALSLSIALPPEVEMTDSQVKQFTLQDGPDWQGITPVSGTPDSMGWFFDLTPFQDTMADEGFYCFFQYRFIADCTAAGAYPLQVQSLVDFADGIPTEADTIWVEATEYALKPLVPNLDLFNPLPALLAFDNKARWNFSLSNVPNSVSGQESGTLYHAWLAPISGSGLLSDFELIDTQSGQSFPAINGIFQLDSLEVNQTRLLRLIARNESCLEETLEVRYGFGCSPYLSLDPESCKSEVQYWQVLAPPGGVDMEIFSLPDTCALLCDTVPYHTVTVYNTDLGPVCDPYIDAILPPGLSITPGSSQLSYPVGAPFVPVADPVYVGSGIFRWKLSDLSPEIAENCLAGIGVDSLHQISLRFWSETDCDFSINSSIIFQASGQRNCGDPINFVTRLGDPICIQTEGDDIQTYFQAELEDAITCQDTGLFNLALVHGAVSAFTDTLRLLLPPGLSYIPGSIIPVANPPDGEPFQDTLNDRIRLHWALPPGLDPFTLVAFQFQLDGFSSLPCGEDYFFAALGIQSEAVCAADGDTCSIRVETGSEYISFSIERPILTIEGFQVQWHPDDTIHATVSLSNSTPIPAENVILDIYLDTDGDGQGDSLLLSPVIPEIAILDSLSFSFPGTLSEACGLLAVLDSTQQCLCGFAIQAPEQAIEYDQAIELTGCSGQPVVLGQCIANWETQWISSEPLSCDTCCISEIVLFNPSDSLLYYSLDQVLENVDGCILHIPYQLDIRPEPGIAYIDPVACAGEAVNLIAEAGTSFFWEGPGVSTPQQQGITVFPSATSTYTLTMEDEYGCPGIDSALVTVFPIPLADAGMDTVFCPGAVFQLHAFEAVGYQYLWSPAAAFEDATVPAPLFSDPVDGNYVLTVIDGNGCKHTDTVEVAFGETPDLMIPADTLICLGDSLWLQANGSYSSLQWEPAATVQCLNPPLCDSILLIPAGSEQFTVTATNSDQCIAVDSFSVEVVDDSAFSLDTIFTCSNEPVWVGTFFTSTPGLYCDTIVLPSGCMQIHCTELMVGDTSSQMWSEIICMGDSLEFGGQWFFLPGVHVISLSTTQGCDSTLVLNLGWWEIPDNSILPGDTTIIQGNSVELILQGAGSSILWEPSNSLDCDTCAQVLATPLETTTYQLSMVDENGCTQILESTVNVRIDCDPERVQIPNAFTPDGDGRNDTFGILTVAENESVWEMQVWNRWGQRVYRSTDSKARWNGTINGKPAPSDVYAYRIVVGCPDGYSKVYIGEISLLR